MTVVRLETIQRGYSPTPQRLEYTGTESALGDDYTTIIEYDCSKWPESKVVTVKNTHASAGLKYSVYVSDCSAPESTDWVVLVGTGGATDEQTVAAGVVDYQSSTLPWYWIKVVCKNAVGGVVSSTRVKLTSSLRTA